jgi:hypothetical protein
MGEDKISVELAKMSPPVVLTAGEKFGLFTLQDWQCIVTIVYAFLGILYLGLKIWRTWKNRNN